MTVTKYPSQIALEERESALSQEVADYREARLLHYNGFNAAEVKKIYTERRANRHSNIRDLKPGASKHDHVRALVDNDVNGHASKVALINLRKAAEGDEAILDSAVNAPTYKQVLEARKASLIEQLDGAYHDTHHVGDVLFDYEIRLQGAVCWAHVRYLIEEKGKTPTEALLDVVAQTKESIVATAFQGTSRSSSPTSNLQQEYSLRGLGKWLDDVKYLVKRVA